VHVAYDDGDEEEYFQEHLAELRVIMAAAVASTDPRAGSRAVAGGAAASGAKRGSRAAPAPSAAATPAGGGGGCDTDLLLAASHAANNEAPAVEEGPADLDAAWRQGLALALVHFSAQPEPFWEPKSPNVSHNETSSARVESAWTQLFKLKYETTV